MNIYETLGLAWVIFTAAAGHVAILWLAYSQLRRHTDLAARGAVEERRDVREQLKMREVLR